MFYPLNVLLCEACLLVQLPAYVSGEHIFSDYAYFSSYSDSWVAHAKRYADGMTAALGLLTGVWVALSPLFLTLQYSGTNATTVDLISGLAVAGVGIIALASPRGFPGLQLGSALLGVWLIIAGPILNQKHPIADPLYWSNSWAGGVLIALAAVGLAAVALRRPARR